LERGNGVPSLLHAGGWQSHNPKEDARSDEVIPSISEISMTVPTPLVQTDQDSKSKPNGEMNASSFENDSFPAPTWHLRRSIICL